MLCCGPSVVPGAVASAGGGGQTQPLKRFVTGGSDCLVKIWEYKADSQSYETIAELPGHQNWVRDVAWAPTILTKSYIASASQDKTVKIWSTRCGVGDLAEYCLLSYGTSVTVYCTVMVSRARA